MSGPPIQLQQTNIQDIEYGALPDGSVTSNLQAKVAIVRQSRINWQSYLQYDSIHFDTFRGQMITSEQFNFISQFDNATTPEARSRIISENQHAVGPVAKIFIALLSKISKEQTLQYVISLLDDVFQVYGFTSYFPQEDKSRVELFHNYFAEKNENIWNHFFNFLQRPNLVCVYQISRIITKLACWSSKLMEESSLRYFLDWLQESLRQANNEYLQTVARNLQMLLRIREYRATFVAQQGVDTLLKVLRQRDTNCELVYQIIFCLWCLSFSGDLVETMIKDATLLPAVADVFCDTEREKVLRISMAFLRSVLEKLEDSPLFRQSALRLVQCKVLKRLELLAQKDFSHDPEMTDDMKFLQETLKTSVQDVSSLEEYTTELTSGRLEWSPVHKSEKFWRENADKFTEKNYELLK
ncbi:unnamed protein product [Dibothriocephalus latus]|uniref:ATPase V1 complex subunit H C-terminal domain-containing protein n=1 Tax=Dibothriocephalus latus TaxID=60516 RepID=A0A3P7KZV9_DIBLA|nr:unnamed protein product [Dibothriocephalus latus]